MLQPINNKVLLKRLAKEASSGLIIVNQNDRIIKCEVLAVAQGETELHVGFHVLVPVEMTAEVSEGLLIDKKDIMAIVQN